MCQSMGGLATKDECEPERRIYRLSVTGFDTYHPADFVNPDNPTEEEFRKDVRYTIGKYVKEVLPEKVGICVNGFDILEFLECALCENLGYRKIKPYKEIRLEGEGYYDSQEDSPPLDVFGEEDAKRIIEHNISITRRREG